MTIWLYYMVSDAPTSDTIPLFGYTTKKKVKDNFEKTRNMSLFITKKREITRTDYIKFQDGHQEKHLDMYSFVTGGPIGPTAIYMAATTREAMKVYMTDDKVLNKLAMYTNPAFIFVKEKYRKILGNLFYYSLMHWYSNSNVFFSETDSDYMSHPDRYLFNDRGILIDQLGVFIMYFGNTLN